MNAFISRLNFPTQNTQRCNHLRTPIAGYVHRHGTYEIEAV